VKKSLLLFLIIYYMKYLLIGEESERLKFRLLHQDDFDTWLPFFEDKSVAPFLAMDPTKTKHELCEFWFSKVFNRYENDLGGMNALIDKSTGNFIGQCGLLVQEVEGISRLEVGYSILPKYWSKGYALEAAKKCKEFAFENNYTDTLISIIHPENIASEKVAIKNGMTLFKNIDGEFHGMPANLFQVKKQPVQK
jgi:ribosomal-protein-alanine N-acetyltransferase